MLFDGQIVRYLIHVRLHGIAYYPDGEANWKSWNKYIIAIVIIRCNDVERHSCFAMFNC